MDFFVKIVLTVLQFGWSVHWALVHNRIRKNRAYAHGRVCAATNTLYKMISPLLFVSQLGLTTVCLWSDSPWLFEFHRTTSLNVLGGALLVIGAMLYSTSLAHLENNYSPCYDSHLPKFLVQTGPYRWIRHPMYLAKLMVGTGTVLLSGSIWFLPPTVYLFYVTLRSLRAEESQLSLHVLAYRDYRERTRRILPLFY